MGTPYDDFVQRVNIENHNLQTKVHDLENTLKSFRAETEMKITMLERIFALKNDQFLAQKQLLEREHALYESIMSQWKNGAIAGEASAKDMPIGYSKTRKDLFQDDKQEHDEVSSLSQGKRVSRSPASNDLKQRLIAKRRRIAMEESRKDVKYENDDDNLQNSNDDNEQENTPRVAAAFNSDGDYKADDQNDGDLEDEGMERKVFINVDPSEGGNDPLWNHMLREENGMTLLCKHCDDKGFQKIYKLNAAGNSVARRHLKLIHKIHIDPSPSPRDLEDGRSMQTEDRKKTIRHNDYLYRMSANRSSGSYWRCRISKTCNGKLIVRRDGAIHESGEHNCLTTATDCDVAELRENLRGLAEDDPSLPIPDVIAAAKEGYTDEVLKLLPNDESLGRTISRIRIQLLNSASTIT